MLSKRIIPCLLIDNEKLVHIKNFDKNKTRYIGDPINAINIFNDYEVDELVVLDINATKRNLINFEFLKYLSDEAFFPLSYGGGIKNGIDAQHLINIGYEKIILNKHFFDNQNIINDCAKKIGSQSVIIALDVIYENNNYLLYDHYLSKKKNKSLDEVLKELNNYQYGELLITSVSNDGMMDQCNFDLIKYVENKITVPIIYKGGATNYEDIKKCLKYNISAFSSGTIFIMKQKDGGIVLNYPSNSFKENIC